MFHQIIMKLIQFSFWTGNTENTITVNNVRQSEKDWCVSAKSTLSHNRSVLLMLESITMHEELPRADESAFEKFVQAQKNYFYQLYPTKWEPGKVMLGWDKIYTGAYVKVGDQLQRVVFYCPARDKKKIERVWRSYDGACVYHCKVLGEYSIEYLNSNNIQRLIAVEYDEHEVIVQVPQKVDYGPCPYTTYDKLYGEVHPEEAYSFLYKSKPLEVGQVQE